jgi:basic amino acid/polyamine antiporter, APA family
MISKQLFAKKSLERLRAEMEGEHRLRRVLGPVALTAIGIGSTIGSGIFVTTGETAATKAGPAVILSYLVAGLGCALAGLCYCEFASLAPVAGSAYTYAYATLGELFAWIIGWDLILEYTMSCGVVAADWPKYFNELLAALFGEAWRIPDALSNDPFTAGGHGVLNLAAVIITALVTVLLVIGIRESAATNTLLVAIKVGVILFIIVVGCWYINPANWTSIPVQERRIITVPELLQRRPDIAHLVPSEKHRAFTDGEHLLREHPEIKEVITSAEEKDIKALKSDTDKWGLISVLGLNRWLEPLDERTRSPFMPFGFTGILVASAAVFFAYIGFDSISTNAEEARKPQRDVPIGILASLVVCTVLYLCVSAVITGIEPYPRIDENAAVAVAFANLAKQKQSVLLRIATGLISAGAVAGMTSVLLVTLQGQARIFLAMARDGLLPQQIFGVVHERFKTPHLSTLLTGALLCVITAFTPINMLFNLVNIGTLLAFMIVCVAVLILRIARPDAPRPFRCPFVYVIAPLGIFINLLMMMFLPLDTWLRLVGWLLIGLVIYFGYGYRRTVIAREQWRQQPGHDDLDADAYFRSGEYRRRLRFSLRFCALLAAVSVPAALATVWLWHHGALTTTMIFGDPLTVVWLVLAASVFLLCMFFVNFVEWQRVQTTKLID